MRQNSFYFKLLITILINYWLSRLNSSTFMMLQLTNMHHRMDFDAGRKLQTHSNWIDDLSNAIRSSPLGSQLPGESPSKLKVISLQPSKVPK